jgi:hypothetical protein
LNASLLTLVEGLICLVTALGTGLILLWLLRFEGRAWLRFPVALFVGTAFGCTCTVILLVCGAGVQALRALSCLMLAAGVWGCLVRLKPADALGWAGRLRQQGFLSALVVVSLALNLIVALAPSTKIDEIRYHMLIPQRIVADNGLRAYREPWEAAIPQTQYEIGLSLVDVRGWTDAPNVLSWGLSAAMVLLIAGITAQLASSVAVGLLAAGLAVAGLHPAVDHVTGGSHALGDLAMAIAVVLCLTPPKQIDSSGRVSRLAILAVACAVAASTKLTTVPVSAALTVWGGYRGVRSVGLIAAIAAPSGAWLLCYAPLVCWFAFQTGSPFGAATSSLFHSMFFDSATLAKIYTNRSLPNLRSDAVNTILMYSPAVILAMCLVAAGLREYRELRFLSLAVIAQAILLALVCPPDLRFMGGLQICALIGAVWILARSPGGRRCLARPVTLAIFLAVPWLAIQARYAAIFFPPTFGLETKEAFLRRCVPLAADLAALDRLLPANAVLYAPNGTIPSIYAPRPVEFASRDLPPDRPVFFLQIGPRLDRAPHLCRDVVYENLHAVVLAFRTMPPQYGPVRVLSCGTSGYGPAALPFRTDPAARRAG